MKKLGVVIIITLFLISFVAAITIFNPTGYTTENNNQSDEDNKQFEIKEINEGETGTILGLSVKIIITDETNMKNTSLILVEGTEINLDSQDNPKKTITISEIGYEIELISASDISSIIKITADSTEDKEEDENETEIEENTTSEKNSQNRIKEKIKNTFCGTSTFGACKIDEDCITGGCSGSVCQSKNEEPNITTCEYKDCYNAEGYNTKCVCKKNRCTWNKITQNQIKNIIKATNRLKAAQETGECPEKCTCAGSVTKCQLANGTREMTIVAGKSGNTIVQVKNANMSTKVALYKENDVIYGVFKNNQTRIIKIMPDQIKEKIRERLNQKECDCENITLDEEGIYQVQTRKKARLFLIFPVRERVRVELNSETGEVIRARTSWWGFLARDDSEEQIVGASCGTVTLGYNNECCQNKEYDFWNETANECQFNSED